MRLRTISAMLAVAFLAAACEQQAKDDTQVLARVNGEEITQRDYDHYLQLRQTRGAELPDKEKEKEVVINEMIDRVLLSQAAEKKDLHKDPEVRLLIERVRENILVQAMIRNMLKENTVSDDDLKKRFEQEVKDTHKLEYRVRHILVKSEEEAKDVIRQLDGKADFNALAKQKSIDVQSAKNGGSLGWINQGMVVPEFFAGVTGVEKGKVSKEPVKSDFGWHIIKVEDTRPADIPSFDEFMADRQAKANFYRKIQDEKIEQLVKDLREKADIKKN